MDEAEEQGAGFAARQAMTMYCRFCADVSIAQEDPANSLLKHILCFQKNISVRQAYDAIFTEDHNRYIDWGHTHVLAADRIYASSATWVHLMNYIAVPTDKVEFILFLKKHPVLLHFAQCLEKAQVQVSQWGLVALYFLTNVSRLESLHAFEQFFSINENIAIREQAMVFFSQLANKQFDREEQTRAFVDLATRHCELRHAIVCQELDLMQNQSRELASLFKQRQMRAITGRPRLRTKLRRDTAGASSQLFEMDLFDNWCNAIRFSNTFSLTQRKRLYFVMSQHSFDPQQYLDRLVADADLSRTISRYTVKSPEVDKLCDCILETRIVSEPFQELHQFRSECFHSFAHEQRSRLRFNDLLHLYIAAYQQPSVWREVWKLVFPVLSIQIIRDVEGFVARVPFAHSHVIDIFFGKDRPQPSRRPQRLSDLSESPHQDPPPAPKQELPHQDPPLTPKQELPHQDPPLTPRQDLTPTESPRTLDFDITIVEADAASV